LTPERPMKILYCKNNFAGPISGADEIAVMYAIELKAAGHDTRILLVHAPLKNDPLVKRLRAANVPLSTLASPVFSSSLEAARKLAIRAMHAFTPASDLIRTNSRRVVAELLQRYYSACRMDLKNNRPDVVHVLTPGPGAEVLIRAAHDEGIPVIYQEVGIPFHPPGFEDVYERFVSVLPLCSEVAVLSPALATEVSRVLPQVGPTKVLPLISPDYNGIPDAKLNSEVVTFGFSARLEHLKGPIRLLEGFSIAHQTAPNIALKIAGEGSQRQEFIALSRRLGVEQKCELVGVYSTLQERAEFMAGIDVFVLPSLTEGTPNVIVEAMAHAKPTIAGNVGGVPDLLAEGVGLLVSPDDVRELGAAMVRLTDPALRKEMGLAARKRYEELFTPRAVLPMLLDFYNGIVEGGSASPALNHPWSNNGR
jgi:glycosyltransferase involved in cell wall biosynthesis